MILTRCQVKRIGGRLYVALSDLKLGLKNHENHLQCRIIDKKTKKIIEESYSQCFPITKPPKYIKNKKTLRLMIK